MRTRLARLLLAAARRLDREGCVVPEGATRSVEVQGAVKESLARQAGLAHYLVGLGAASGGAILGPPSRPADPVPAKLSEGGRVCETCWMPLERRAYEVPIDGRMQVLGVSPWHCPGGHDQSKPFPGSTES